VPFSQFAQPPGVHETLPDARDPDGPVYLAGDYTHNSSINGAMESGLAAADAVRTDLQ
jgi:predicted NAD/FAD-dependent oxidoreductase